MYLMIINKIMKDCLILNADFQPLSLLPLSTLTWKQACLMKLAHKIIVMEEHEFLIRSPSLIMKCPSVSRLSKYVKPNFKVKFNRTNVYIRDKFSCQYCHKTNLKYSELTLDHVVPRSKGGTMRWSNAVSACKSCNLKKGNDFIRPNVTPSEPTYWDLLSGIASGDEQSLHASWISYLPARYLETYESSAVV
jgi:5-methylcytosine-specific restriction endonuclease McrA